MCGRSYALVYGSCINQGGRSSGLTAPNGPAQTALVRAALADAHSTHLNTVSMHGTGTALGDPIEVGALGQTLPSAIMSSDMNTASSLVSSKSCFGHTEGTAGITGLLLSISVMRQCASPPVANLRSVNPYVEAALGSVTDITGYCVMRALRQAAPAEPGIGTQEHVARPTLAGCSSFGMSGVNAHIITSQYGNAPASGTEHNVRVMFRCGCICSSLTSDCWMYSHAESLSLSRLAARMAARSLLCSAQGAHSPLLCIWSSWFADFQLLNVRKTACIPSGLSGLGQGNPSFRSYPRHVCSSSGYLRCGGNYRTGGTAAACNTTCIVRTTIIRLSATSGGVCNCTYWADNHCQQQCLRAA